MGEASEKALARRLRLLATLALSASPVFAHPGIGIVADNHGNVFYTDLRPVRRMSRDGQREGAVRNVHAHELYIAIRKVIRSGSAFGMKTTAPANGAITS
jgi:hypothetical protein